MQISESSIPQMFCCKRKGNVVMVKSKLYHRTYVLCLTVPNIFFIIIHIKLNFRFVMGGIESRNTSASKYFNPICKLIYKALILTKAF